MNQQKMARSLLVVLVLIVGFFASTKIARADGCDGLPMREASQCRQQILNFLNDEMNMRKEMANMPTSERVGIERPSESFEEISDASYELIPPGQEPGIKTAPQRDKSWGIPPL